MSAEYGSYGYYASSGGAASSSAVTTAPPSTDEVTATPYTAIFNIVGPALTNSDISYDTSSKDPHMIRARVFIGNIARAIITRDDIIDLFRPFGKLLAVNYFAQQGFAFVQFNEAAHADQSCLALNATQWKSCCLDVHLAMLGAVSKNIDSIKSGPPVAPIPSSLLAKPTAKTAKVEKPVPPSLKRQPDEEVYASYEQSKRKHANADKTANDELTPNQMCDTMLCGNCRFVSSDFEEFRDHRITGCTKYEESEEPTHRLKCATCNERFIGAWGLLEHLTEFHRMVLFNEEKLPNNESAPNSQRSSEKPTAPTASHETSAEPTRSESASNQGTPQI